MDSPNSGSLLFLAFWEMPAMDSPSTCRAHHTSVMETTSCSHSAPKLRAHCASPTGEESPFPLPPRLSQTFLILPQTSTSGSGLTLEFSMTLSRQLK